MSSVSRAALGVMLVCCLTGAARAGDRFPGTDITKPDFFPIMPWDPLHGWEGTARDSATNGLESIAQCGFNFAGFVLPKDLKQCERLGLAAIVMTTHPGKSAHQYQPPWRKYSAEQVEAKVRSLIRDAGSSRAIKGYFIMDEPSINDFPGLARAVAAVKKYAPGKLAYINLFPDYATLGAPDRSQLGTSNYTEYVERFVNEVKPQCLSYDNYMVQYSDDLKKGDVAKSYFQNLAEVRRIGLKYNLPCLQIVAANQLRSGHTIPSPANLALQAYTTLAAGFRGVTWYTFFGRHYGYAAVDNDGQKTLTWEWLREINRQVAALKPALASARSTGIFFTESVPYPGLPKLPGALVQTVSGSQPMMIGEFAGGQQTRLAMLVNLNLAESANFQFTLTKDFRMQQISPVDGARRDYPARKDGYWLAAGQGVLLELSE